MNTTLKKTPWLLAWGAAVLLTACGGGGGGGSDAPMVRTTPTDPAPMEGTGLPAAVEQNTSGVIDFAKMQLASTSDTREPLVVGNTQLATDDFAEPAAI